LDSGLLEIVPCRYRVVGGSEVFDTPPGGEFDAAMRLSQETLLMAGGHIERVESEVVATRRVTPPTKEKE
jgi:hypothetical protein